MLDVIMKNVPFRCSRNLAIIAHIIVYSLELVAVGAKRSSSPKRSLLVLFWGKGLLIYCVNHNLTQIVQF